MPTPEELEELRDEYNLYLMEMDLRHASGALYLYPDDFETWLENREDN